MSVDLVTIALFETAAEASPARSLLEAEGIRTYLQGELTGNTLWHVGTALGGVKLQVEGKDVQQANKILQQHFDEVESSEDVEAGFVPNWVCPRCGAEVDAGFEICWSCGADIEGVPSNTTFDIPEEPESDTGEQSSVESTNHPVWFNLLGLFFSILLLGLIAQIGFYFQMGSSYYLLLLILPLALLGFSIAHTVTTRRELKAWTPDEGDSEETEELPEVFRRESHAHREEQSLENMELLKRAWRTAVIGAFLCPLLLNVYSMIQLIQYIRTNPYHSRPMNWRLPAAYVLNLLVILFALLFIGDLFMVFLSSGGGLILRGWG